MWWITVPVLFSDRDDIDIDKYRALTYTFSPQKMSRIFIQPFVKCHLVCHYLSPFVLNGFNFFCVDYAIREKDKKIVQGFLP